MSRPRLSPFFLDGPAGRLFAVLVTPLQERPERAVLYLPPFAEEMNRSRRMAALQARRLAEAGAAVLLLDLYGTGDSEGDFHDARWEIWIEDARAALRWLADHGWRASLWGLRLGATLAAHVAAGHGGIEGLILWQPVPSGDALLTQFLRIRLAAGMEAANSSGMTTSALKSALLEGESVEVAGYTLAPELAVALTGVRLEALPLPDVPVHWLEVASAAGAPPPPARRRVIEGWRAAGSSVAAETVVGEPFWALQEITLAPNLWEPTVRVWKAVRNDRESNRLCLS